MDFPVRDYPKTSTVAGKDVLIYNIHAGGTHPIHGAYWAGDDQFQWVQTAWTLSGKLIAGENSPLDLAVSFEN